MTRLRPPRAEELEQLEQWRADPASPYEDWSGDPPAGVERSERLPAPLGGGKLVVTDDADLLLGDVSWHPRSFGPNAGSGCFDTGISLRPHARGAGHGSRAQRLLADYLFATTPVHRVQAETDVDNTAERRALVRAGFTEEGVLRGAQWRGGRYCDLVSYSRLRTDA